MTRLVDKTRRRAFVKNEGTITERYAVYTEAEYGNGAWMAARFSWRRSAVQIADALNDAWETEGRLWKPRPPA
jgi:hypothetical protein